MGKQFFIVFVGFLILIGVATNVEEAKAIPTEKDLGKEPTAILSCFGYGYKVNVKMNGSETGVKGGQSEVKRLFYKTSRLAKDAPDFIKPYFLLNKGENHIQAEFTKVEKTTNLTLYVWLQSEPIPSFLLYSETKPQGKIDKKFIIDSPLPKDFKPVIITDAGEDKAVLIFVSAPATVRASLNGKAGTSITGMIGPIVLENIKTGTNNLTINYQADPAETKEVKIAIATPEWLKVISKKATGKPVTEEFVFVVK